MLRTTWSLSAVESVMVTEGDMELRERRER